MLQYLSLNTREFGNEGLIVAFPFLPHSESLTVCYFLLQRNETKEQSIKRGLGLGFIWNEPVLVEYNKTFLFNNQVQFGLRRGALLE